MQAAAADLAVVHKVSTAYLEDDYGSFNSGGGLALQFRRQSTILDRLKGVSWNSRGDLSTSFGNRSSDSQHGSPDRVNLPGVEESPVVEESGRTEGGLPLSSMTVKKRETVKESVRESLK